MSVKVTLNKRRVLKRITSGADNARAVLTEQVYQDSEEYTPRDKGKLIETARIDSKNGTITYTQPYAKKLWNGIDYIFLKLKVLKPLMSGVMQLKQTITRIGRKLLNKHLKKG